MARASWKRLVTCSDSDSREAFDWQERAAVAALINPKQRRGKRGKLSRVEHHAKLEKPEGLSPFERFLEFARHIIAVPKAEIDKQEAQYQREWKKLKKVARR